MRTYSTQTREAIAEVLRQLEKLMNGEANDAQVRYQDHSNRQSVAAQRSDAWGQAMRWGATRINEKLTEIVSEMEPSDFCKLDSAEQIARLEEATLLGTAIGLNGHGDFFALYRLNGFFVEGVCRDQQAFDQRQFDQLLSKTSLTPLERLTYRLTDTL